MGKIPITALLVVFIFAGAASASCRTYWDYCGNFTMPSYNTTAGNEYNAYYVLELDDLQELTTVDGLLYINSTLETVYARVYNTTDTTNGALFTGPDRQGGNSFGLEFQKIGCANGCVNTSIVEICLNGTYLNNYPTTGGPIPPGQTTPTTYVSEGSLNKYYRRNWTFYHEENGSFFNFANRKAEMDVLCDNLNQFEINLTDEVARGQSITIQTFERPTYMVSIDSTGNQIRQDIDNFLVEGYYLGESKGKLYTLTLQDYSGGQYYRSTLNIQRNVNDEWVNVDVQRFSQDNIIYAYLQNATQYRFIVTSDTGTRDLGTALISDLDLTRDIVVSKPDFSDWSYAWEGCEIAFTRNYDNSQLGCAVNCTISTTVYFEVYNYSTSGEGTLDHYGTGTGTDVALTHTVDDPDATYYVKCAINDTTYDLREKTQTIHMHNESGFYLGFDLDLPATTMGISRSTIYKLISVSVAVLIGALFSAVSYSVGGLAMIVVAGFFNWVGWLQAPWEFISFLGFLAAFVHLAYGRVGVAT